MEMMKRLKSPDWTVSFWLTLSSIRLPHYQIFDTFQSTSLSYHRNFPQYLGLCPPIPVQYLSLTHLASTLVLQSMQPVSQFHPRSTSSSSTRPWKKRSTSMPDPTLTQFLYPPNGEETNTSLDKDTIKCHANPDFINSNKGTILFDLLRASALRIICYSQPDLYGLGIRTEEEFPIGTGTIVNSQSYYFSHVHGCYQDRKSVV